jgi:hypothetical protein
MRTQEYRFDTQPVDGIKGLCRRLTGKALQSPFRSTVPLLSLIEHSQPAWHALLGELKAPAGGTIHFEYCVPSPKVDGNPSQTDALLTSDTTVWAIEAKWTEPRYETVAKRIARPEADGTDARATAAGWLTYLQPFATRELRVEDALGLVYQVVHRAASACFVASAKQLRPHLVYLHFHPSLLASSATTEQYISDLRDLKAAMGTTDDMSFTVVEMPLEPTPAFEAIKGLDKRDRGSAGKVKEALCSAALFAFGQPTVTRI